MLSWDLYGNLTKTPEPKKTYDARVTVKSDEYIEGMICETIGTYPTAANAEYALRIAEQEMFDVVRLSILRSDGKCKWIPLTGGVV